jgi:glycosyltransferase involved in cell wall biosynthesis
MTPKVLLVGHLPPAAGGITSLLLTILRSPITQKYEFITFNIARPAKKNVIDNFGYRALLNCGVKRAILAIIITVWHMLIFPAVVLWHRPAIVHIHTSAFLVFWETAYYVLVTRILQIPCGLQFHYSFRCFYETSHSWLRGAMLRVIRWPTVFVVICKEDIEFVTKRVEGRFRGAYLANFIDIDAFQHAVSVSRERIGKRAGVVVLFMGGNELVRKGVFDLLQAIRILNMPRSSLRFLLVAVPPEEVQSRLQRELLSCCDIQTWVSGASKTDVFGQADIFVLPSYGEGMPIGILEAMASSVPVIGTRVGGIPDLITENKEGYLVDPGDVDGLARAIYRLASDSRTREDMGKTGLEKARSLYDISVGIERLHNLYEEMLKSSLPL